MKYYALGERPVTVLKKVTARSGGRRKRLWLVRLPDGEERWIWYPELVRVSLPGKNGLNGNGNGAKC